MAARPPVSQRGRIGIAAVVFAVALAASGGVVSAAAYVRRPVTDARSPQPVTVQMAGSSEFFSNSAVKAELHGEGIVVQQTPLGSKRICKEPELAQRFDVTNSGSQDAATCVEPNLHGARLAPSVSYPFSSPMVIITYDPIVALLETLGVVTQGDGLTIFNVAAYLKVVNSGLRWIDIPGNQTYPSRSPILISATNPQDSNSGGMLAAIEYAALNNNDPIANVQRGDWRPAVIRKSFDEQGSLSTHTPDLLQHFLTDGMDAYPMAMVYEDDYIYLRLSGQAGPNSGITVMYPDPDVVPDNTLVCWTPAGNRLTTLLASPTMMNFEERNGYRTSRDGGGKFVSYMAARGITVPNLNNPNASLQFSGLPTEPSLQALINLVSPG